MTTWVDPRTEVVHEFEIPMPELYVSENPIIGVILGPDEEILAAFLEREPIGFR